MSGPNQTSVRNGLLSLLPSDTYELIQPYLEAVTLNKGLVLIEPNQPIPYGVFPDGGMGSVVAVSRENHKSEVGMFGRDGFSGMPLLLAVDRTPQLVLIQVEGAGHRVSPGDLQRLARESRSLREALLHYIHAFGTQTSHTALQREAYDRGAFGALASHGP